MSFELTESQRQLQAQVREFAASVIASEVEEMDRKSVLNKRTYRRMGEEGFLGLCIPEEYGGKGGGVREYCIFAEEVARVSLSYIPNAHFQTLKMILGHGTEEQKREYLPKLASGEYIAATAISEPEMGSSFARIATTARREGDSFIINGYKSHINYAAEAHLANLLAKTEKGITMFLVERGTPGFRVAKKLDPVGMRAAPMYDIEVTECKIPQDQMLGVEGEGVAVFLTAFNFSRLGNASAFIGAARGALEEAIEYTKGRKIREDQVVTDFQGIRWVIAELTTKIEAAALLRDKAAWLADQGREHALETSQAKLMAGEVAQEVVNKAIDIAGAHGCYRDTPYERYLRDVKALRIGGGSLEVMRNVIARQVLG